MKKRNIFLILFFAALVFTGCKYDFVLPAYVPPVEPGGQPVSFSTQVVPIFSNGKCTQCHKPGGLGTPDLSNSATIYSLIVPKYVNTSDPANSTIYVNASSGNHNGAKVSASDAALLLQWITEGAQNN